MKKLLSGLALGILVSNAAHADHRYAALDIGQSKFTDACKGLPSGWSCSNSATTLRGSVGYFFGDKFSAELGYADFGTANRSAPPVGGNAQRLDTSSSAVQLSAVGHVVVFDMFMLTGKVGMVRSSTTTNAVLPGGVPATYTAAKTSLGYGIGTEFFFGMDDPLIIRLQYEDLGTFGNAATGTTRMRLLSAGVVTFF